MISPQAVQSIYDGNVLVIGLNTKGLVQADSLIQPLPEGNTLNWILGHIVANRNTALDLLGQPRIWDDTRVSRYRRYSEPATAGSEGIVPLEELLADLGRTQEQLVAALAAISQEALDQPLNDGTLGQRLLGLAWHETYHAGQTDYLRRLAGKSEGGVR